MKIKLSEILRSTRQVSETPEETRTTLLLSTNKATPTDHSERTPKEAPIPIKDLSRDELVTCIRELESVLDETPTVIDGTYGMMDLQIQLKSLEHQRKTGKARPIPLTTEEKAYLAVDTTERSSHSRKECL